MKTTFFYRNFKLLRCVLFPFLLSIFILSIFTTHAQSVPSQNDDIICAIYISGIGCHNCAVTDPVIFTSWTDKYPNLIIFEYEIWTHKKENKKIKDQYFQGYLSGKRTGIPFMILNKKQLGIGKYNVLFLEKEIGKLKSNPYPLSYGSSLDFYKVDLLSLPGKVNIWTKNRILIPGKKGNNVVLRRILTEENLSQALEGVEYNKVIPVLIPISGAEIPFDHAVMIGDWMLQWNGEAVDPVRVDKISGEKYILGLIGILVVLGVSFSMFRVRRTSKGGPLKFELKARLRDCIIVGVSLIALVVFFWVAQKIPPDFLKETGHTLPLPVFTFIIALIDGFNPCNMFVLTCLLALLISTSASRKRLYVVAISFVAMVYVFYFMFMAAWLNVFKYISFITPLRMALGSLALIAGLINCKELLFFHKGFSLMIQDHHKSTLMKKLESMKEIIKSGSFPLLITSSLGLAALASLIELPCTAGFPIIYTGVLSGKGLDSTVLYYVYLVFYNAVYVIPLFAVVTIFIYTFRARRITQRQMEIIKFIGGIIMVLLGIILLVKPALLGLSMG